MEVGHALVWRTPEVIRLGDRSAQAAFSAIVVVQAAEDGKRHNSTRFGRRLQWAGDALVCALMGPCVIEVGHVLLDDAVKMALVEEQEVVQALPA